MSDTLKNLARDRFAALIVQAMEADVRHDTDAKERYMKQANTLAEQVFRTSSLADFAFVTGATF